MRYTADFLPQVWYNNCALAVDPEGETVWDCTQYVKSMFDDDTIDKMLAGMVPMSNDMLRDDPNAPKWVRYWTGPYEITLHENTTATA